MKTHNSRVTVIAPARLHMGFIDLSGSLGRQFGSIGLALNEIAIKITVTRAASNSLSGMHANRIRLCLKNLCRTLELPEKHAVQVVTGIPEHNGLGSGTQIALAVGMALNHLYDLQLSIREIAQLTDRGARSGIGIGVFEHGGLVVDGGRGDLTKTPPVISHMQVPEDWRFILVFDQRGQGLHGEKEIQAFHQLAPFPRSEVERLCYLLMMQGLPALAEQDLLLFGDVITQLQNAVGEHFSPAQGGVFTSQEVANAIAWLAEQGAVCIGQTSWGPTGFCAVADPERAAELLRLAEAHFAENTTIRFMITSARNNGGKVLVEQ